jgi:hypothetical protein
VVLYLLSSLPFVWYILPAQNRRRDSLCSMLFLLRAGHAGDPKHYRLQPPSQLTAPFAGKIKIAGIDTNRSTAQTMHNLTIQYLLTRASL